MSNSIASENSIHVVTAIGSPDREAIISRALFNSGKDIRFRALSFAELSHYVASLHEDQNRWLIVASHDLLGINAEEIHRWSSDNISCVILDPSTDFLSSDEITALVSQRMRAPMVHTPLVKHRKLINAIAVTGTSGAPGRTTIAINLAREIASQRHATLVDADSLNPAIEHLLGLTDYAWRTHAQKNISPHLTITSELNLTSESIDRETTYISDCGALIDIAKMRTDRRHPGAIQAQWIESAATIIFVTRADEISLRKLSEFVSQRRQLPSRTEVIYLLNFVGHSRRYRELEKNFRSIAPGPKFIARSDYATMDRVVALQSTIADVAPRSPLRKMIKEISTHLLS